MGNFWNSTKRSVVGFTEKPIEDEDKPEEVTAKKEVGKFILEFDMSNDYFVSGGKEAVLEVLEGVRMGVNRGRDGGKVVDGNGLKVGSWSMM